MEIISFFIIMGLLLSSCTTDEGEEEVVVFKNNADANKWQIKQHEWRMRTEPQHNFAYLEQEFADDELQFSTEKFENREELLVAEFENY